MISKSEAIELLSRGQPVWVGLKGELLRLKIPINFKKIPGSSPIINRPLLLNVNKYAAASNGDKIICLGYDYTICSYCREQQVKGLVRLKIDDALNPPFVIMFMNKSWNHYCKNIESWRFED
jgi:hypothetical protein